MDHRYLRCFIAVAEELSFAASRGDSRENYKTAVQPTSPEFERILDTVRIEPALVGV